MHGVVLTVYAEHAGWRTTFFERESVFKWVWMGWAGPVRLAVGVGGEYGECRLYGRGQLMVNCFGLHMGLGRGWRGWNMEGAWGVVVCWAGLIRASFDFCMAEDRG